MEHDVQPGQYGVAFAQWLANVTGRPMTGEPADGQGPTFTVEPLLERAGEGQHRPAGRPHRSRADRPKRRWRLR